jgi:hypothetical protein
MFFGRHTGLNMKMPGPYQTISASGIAFKWFHFPYCNPTLNLFSAALANIELCDLAILPNLTCQGPFRRLQRLAALHSKLCDALYRFSSRSKVKINFPNHTVPTLRSSRCHT